MLHYKLILVIKKWTVLIFWCIDDSKGRRAAPMNVSTKQWFQNVSQIQQHALGSSFHRQWLVIKAQSTMLFNLGQMRTQHLCRHIGTVFPICVWVSGNRSKPMDYLFLISPSSGGAVTSQSRSGGIARLSGSTREEFTVGRKQRHHQSFQHHPRILNFVTFI